jgi:hypothetical protein
MSTEHLKQQYADLQRQLESAERAEWSATEKANISRIKSKMQEIADALDPTRAIMRKIRAAEEAPRLIPERCTLEYSLNHIRAHLGIRRGDICSVCGLVRA